MAITVASAQTRCNRICNAMSATIALEYMQIIHDELVFQVPINITTEDISVTENIREYANNDDDCRIWLAEWYRSADDFYVLDATDFTRLNALFPNWRKANSGDPQRWYPWRDTSGYVIGLDPKPNASTSGTYPHLRLHVSRKTTLSGSLPPSITSSDVYVYGAAMKHYRDKGPMAKADEMEREYIKALAREVEAHAFYSAEKPPMAVTWVEAIGVGGSI